MKKTFTDNVGRVILTTDGLIDLLFEGQSIDGLIVEENEETIKYNKFNEEGTLVLHTNELKQESIDDYDLNHTQIWDTPTKYREIKIEDWLLSKCFTDIQRDRVLEELNMFEERDLFSLLKHLIFLVDHFRKNKIVWGIGRGSSVSSYVLYLIGIHRVDSIKYNLDIKEFLR